MQKLIGIILEKFGRVLIAVSRRLTPSRETGLTFKDKEVIRWYAESGNERLVQFDHLDSQSVVWDLGGFKGDWAAEIFIKYLCQIRIFEPVNDFASQITRRFAPNRKISVCAYGLGGSARKQQLLVDGVGSSVERPDPEGEFIAVEIQDVVHEMQATDTSTIDLMKINIEGSEYELLNRLFEAKKLSGVKSILIQFHDFFPDSEQKLKIAHQQLSHSHEQIFSYEFVWEYWRVKS
jgi:FkbM family methyltransferase